MTATSLIAIDPVIAFDFVAVSDRETTVQSIHSEIVKEAIDILSKYFNASIQAQSTVQLSDAERRNLLLRIYLQSSQTQVPKSIILKQTLAQKSSTQEDDQIFGRFARDWSGLEFLTQIKIKNSIAPQFYGGSIPHRFILIEDLGENHVSLVDSLTSNKKNWAMEALQRFVKCLGQLHANSYGKTDQYFQILRKIRPYAESQEENYLVTLNKILSGFGSILDQLQIDFPKEAQFEIAEVIKNNLTEGPFTTLIHGDICPDNVFDDQQTNELRQMRESPRL